MFINYLTNIIVEQHYKKRFKKCGKSLRFHPLNSTFSYGNITLGDRVFINNRAYFSAPHGEITIGDDVLFGADVFLSAGHHSYNLIGLPINKQGYQGVEDKIVIHDDVWIASKALILGSVEIHEGTIVGAGSLVLDDLPPYCLCVGTSRCKPIKLRYSDEELRLHLSKLNKPLDEIDFIIKLRKNMTKDLL